MGHPRPGRAPDRAPDLARALVLARAPDLARALVLAPRMTRPARGRLASRADGNPGRRAHPRLQIALRLELGIAVLHQAAGQAELAGQLAGRGEPLAGAQAPRPDRLAQLALELRAQRLGVRPVQGEQ